MTDAFARALHYIGLAVIIAAFFAVAAVWQARAHDLGKTVNKAAAADDYSMHQG